MMQEGRSGGISEILDIAHFVDPSTREGGREIWWNTFGLAQEMFNR